MATRKAKPEDISEVVEIAEENAAAENVDETAAPEAGVEGATEGMSEDASEVEAEISISEEVADFNAGDSEQEEGSGSDERDELGFAPDGGIVAVDDGKAVYSTDEKDGGGFDFVDDGTEQGEAEKAPSKAPPENVKAPVIPRSEIIRDARLRNENRTVRIAEMDKFMGGWAQLRTAMQQKRLIRGQVESVEPKWAVDKRTGLSIPSVVATVVLNDMFVISIPFNELFGDDAIDITTVDMTTQAGLRRYGQRQLTMAEKFVGVEFPFIITFMDNVRDARPDNHVILGSRKEALKIERRLNFYPSKDGGKPRIQKGDIVDCMIISCGTYSVRVSVGGKDLSIQVSDLTYEWLPDAKANSDETGIKPGNTIKLYVNDVQVKGNGEIDFDLSRKPLERARVLSRLNRVNPQMMTHGIVTRYIRTRQHNGIAALIWLKQKKMPAIAWNVQEYRFGTMIRRGDEVVISVREVSENGLIRCNIIRKVQFDPGF